MPNLDAKGGNRGATEFDASASDSAPKVRRFTFNVKELSGLKPAERQYYVWDTDIKGLCLLVTPSGAKVFYLRRKLEGRSERIKLGPYPDLSIDKARGRAGGHLNRIADGFNPADERRSVHSEWTLKQLWEKYLEDHVKPYKRPSSRKADEWLWSHCLAEWAGRRLSSLRLGDVQRLHAGLGMTRGHYTANRAAALLRHMFSKAAEWGYRGGNPCKGLTLYDEAPRERFLQAGELPRFFQALAADPNPTFRDFVLLALLTGQRRTNVAAMRWANVDLEAAVWTIPEAEFKGKRVHAVPLVSAAVKLLRERAADHAARVARVAGRLGQTPGSAREAKHWAHEKALADRGAEWVLPSRGAAGHYMAPRHAWAALLERAGLSGLRVHDLRRTVGSWQAALGANLAVIQKTLGHADVDTTMIYARLNLDPVREAIEQATSALLAAGGVGELAEIERFRSARKAT